MLIYLHGFNSSPASTKARLLGAVMAERGLEDHYRCPELSHRPAEAIRLVKAAIAELQPRPITLIGSSLGGYYATWLAETYGLRAVLINPAVRPHQDLRAFLGAQQNLYTGERYTLTEDHLSEWAGLFVRRVTPSRYLLLVETGDEVLDYREAVERYAGAKQVVVPGGDHSLKSFAAHVGLILEFAGLDTLNRPGAGQGGSV